MKIEVVLFSAPTTTQPNDQRSIELEGVDDITVDYDSRVLSIENEESEVVAEFRDWTYWRKLSD